MPPLLYYQFCCIDLLQGLKHLTLKSSYILPYSIVYSINFTEFVLQMKPKFWNSKDFSVSKLVIKIKKML